jgi:glycosyltransferase involved in cell wall biosynthesis
VESHRVLLEADLVALVGETRVPVPVFTCFSVTLVKGHRKQQLASARKITRWAAIALEDLRADQLTGGGEGLASPADQSYARDDVDARFQPPAEGRGPAGLDNAVVVGEEDQRSPRFADPRVASRRNTAGRLAHTARTPECRDDLRNRFAGDRAVIDDYELDPSGIALVRQRGEARAQRVGTVSGRNDHAERRSLPIVVRHGETLVVRVGLVTRSLLYGGTERQLVALARGLTTRGHEVSILQLYGDSDFGGELSASGIDRSELGVRTRVDIARLLIGARAWRRSRRPEVLYGFHVESNLLCLLLARSARRTRVAWGIRVDDPAALASDALARSLAAVHTRLLRAPDVLLANSGAGARWAIGAGVPAARVRTVPNGIDTTVFREDPEGRARVRKEWGVDPADTLIGSVARLEPRKAPELFLEAAAAVAAMLPKARFAWVGTGESGYAAGLRRHAEELGIGANMIWAGRRLDVAAVHSALDLETLLSSVGEGSSNAIAEALACRRPCVVSDTGDSARVVGEHGLVEQSREPAAVARAWIDTIERSTPETTAAGRAWIELAFPLERMVDECESALADIL